MKQAFGERLPLPLGELGGFCLSGCLSKPQDVVWGRGSAAVSKEPAPVSVGIRYRGGLPAVPNLRWGHRQSDDCRSNREPAPKSDLDAGEWEPPENRGWFAARIVAVKQKYDLSVNPDERDALQAMLNSDPSRTVSCGDGLTPEVRPITSPSCRGSELANHDHLYQLLPGGGDLPNRFPLRSRKSADGLVCGTGNGG